MFNDISKCKLLTVYAVVRGNYSYYFIFIKKNVILFEKKQFNTKANK